MEVHNKNRLMLDIETLGTGPKAVVTSVGVTVFNLDESEVETFYREIPVQPQLDKSRVVTADTIAWWFRQVQVGAECPISLDESTKCLFELVQFLDKYSDCELWAHGTTFDIVIVESLLEDFGVRVPWKFRNVMDCRTITNLIECRSKRNNHNALEDAINQADWVRVALLKLKGI